MEEAVNHPKHYSGEIECWDAMVSAFGKEQMVVFSHITAFKYLWRAGKKGDYEEDIEKAMWYLGKIKELKQGWIKKYKDPLRTKEQKL